MSDVIALSAQTRDRVGGVRLPPVVRLIPAVIYGDRKEPVAVTLNERVLTKQLQQSGFFSTLTISILMAKA